MRAPEYVIRVPKNDILRPKTLERVLSRAWSRSGSVPRDLLAAFAFANDEALFAKELLVRAPQMWLFRTNQRRFSGDFVVVDMSSPVVPKRRSWVVDLKRGAPLRLGGGGAGIQLKNAPLAIAEIARTTGVLEAPAFAERVVGDRREVLRHLGVAA
jgi:hypothetical protein